MTACPVCGTICPAYGIVCDLCGHKLSSQSFGNSVDPRILEAARRYFLLRKFAPRFFGLIVALSLVVFSISEVYTYLFVSLPQNIAFGTTSYILAITSLFLLLPLGVIVTATLLGGLGKSWRDGVLRWWMVRSDRPVTEKKWMWWALPRMSKKEIEQESELREEEKFEEDGVILERRREDFD